MIFLATSFSLAGTESSRSRQMMSAVSVLAFSKNRVLLPGTKIRLLNIKERRKGGFLELLWCRQNLAELLGFCHHDVAFDHVRERQNCVNHRPYLALADPVHHLFKLCLGALRRA